MSELRQDILTDNWAVIAPERGKKPARLQRPDATGDIRDDVEYDESCPFCPGNEKRFRTVSIDEVPGSGNAWRVKTVENKYKIFDDPDTGPRELEPFHKHGVYSHYRGRGEHYVVVEHRTHNRIMGEMKPAEIGDVFASYLKAIRRFRQDPSNLISLVFKNQGASAGGSQPHPHSQIVASRIVPARIRNALHVQERHFDTEGGCAMCALMTYEETCSERIGVLSSEMMVLSPYAASAPHEMWVIPKRHFACFDSIKAGELTDLSRQVGRVLGAYAEKLDNPDFNYFIHSAPNPLLSVPYYHSFLQIVPRTGTIGGFEIGTNLPVNPVTPEEAVRILL